MTYNSLTSVLVVDDDPVLCEVASSYFRNTGAAQISVAHNGRDALDIVEQSDDPLGFILLDLKMPVMDGVQFLRHMQERSYKGPIGIVSGEGTAVSSLAVDIAKKCGLNVVGSLPKPLNSNCLDALIYASGASPRAIRNPELKAFTASELERALAEQHIVAHYQPQIDVASRALVGVEALARWQHPERGLIPPGLFVPLAEDCGLMSQLTDQIISNVIANVGTLNHVDPNLGISINLGAAVLNDVTFPDAVTTFIDESGHDRSRFIFELTESKLVEDSIDSMEVLARLDLAGFQLSLDDFGTQFSNIEQLAKFPFKELKIDQGFVRSAATDDRSKVLVDSCVSLGKQLGMRIVAEGIETKADRDVLTSLGVDVLQGYYFAKPMPIEEIGAWARSYQWESI